MTRYRLSVLTEWWATLPKGIRAIAWAVGGIAGFALMCVLPSVIAVSIVGDGAFIGAVIVVVIIVIVAMFIVDELPDAKPGRKKRED